MVPISSDGFCFLRAVKVALLCDHEYVISEDRLKEKVVDHLKDNINRYYSFCPGVTVDMMVYQALEFFQNRDFTRDIVDILVLVTADALNLTLNIHRRSPAGFIQIKPVHGSNACMAIDLLFHTAGPETPNTYTGANHYEAIVSADVGVSENSTSDTTATYSVDSEETIPINPTQEHEEERHILKSPHDWLVRNSLRPGTVFDTEMFADCIPKKVEFLPPTINGNKVYEVLNCNRYNYSKKTTDRRWFLMTTSVKNSFHGIRKVGFCQGSPVCVNPTCSFSSIQGQNNKWHFIYRDAIKCCYSCKQPTMQQQCLARKLIEIPHDSSSPALVYHLGQHKCELKPDVENASAYTKQWMEKFPGQSFRQLKTSVVDYHLNANNMEEARKAAERITSRAYRKVRRQFTAEVDQDEVSVQSMEAVAILKESSDKLDPFYIYKINSKSMNGQPDFVIKSGKIALQFMLLMDQDGQPNDFQKMDVYFDGSHSRCTEFISLGLWVEHPAQRTFIRLVSMEVRSEKTDSLVLFWCNVNEMLRKFGNKADNYRFNPRSIQCDQAGANFKAIGEVFGSTFVAEKVVTCPWHFMNNIRERSSAMGEKEEEFLKLCKEMTRAKAVAEFDLIYTEVRDLAKDKPNILRQLEWHHSRREYLFAAFRAFRHAGVNLAEVGNSAWKPKQRHSLVGAAKDDINRMMQMEAENKNFSEGESFTRGRVASDAERATRERRHQMEQARSYADMLSNSSAQEAQIEAENNRPQFMPNASARHKPKKNTKNVQGKETKGLRMPPVPPTLNQMLDRLARARRLVDDSNAMPPPPPPVPRSQRVVLGSGPEYRPPRPIPSTDEHPNPPIVVRTYLTISKCHGCSRRIESKQMKAPQDLIFRCS